MPIDAREERRKNAKALAVAGAILTLFGAFAYRPATVIGVDGDALANSLGSSELFKRSGCVELADGRWRCQVFDSSSASTAIVETRAFGCWDLVRKQPGAAVEKSGCIDAFDVVSPL